MHNIVVNMCEKFNNDRLRNDRFLGNEKSDNNKNNNNVRSAWRPVNLLHLQRYRIFPRGLLFWRALYKTNKLLNAVFCSEYIRYLGWANTIWIKMSKLVPMKSSILCPHAKIWFNFKYLIPSPINWKNSFKIYLFTKITFDIKSISGRAISVTQKISNINWANIQFEAFQYVGFDFEIWPWPKLTIWNVCNSEQLWQISWKSTCTSEKLQTSVTNQPTNKHALSQHLLGGGNKNSFIVFY